MTITISKWYALVIISLLFSFKDLQSQTVLVPSKKVVQQKWVKSKDYEMAWFVLRDTFKIEIGKIATNISTDDKNLMIVTRVQMKGVNTPWIDTTIANAKTLSPIMHASYNGQRDMVLNFGKNVSGYYIDKMKKTNTIINAVVEGDYFDSNLYPVLIGWLPLRDGYTQAISIYDYNPSGKMGLLKAYVKSVSSATYESQKSGVRDVWVVTVSDEISVTGNTETVYFFDKADRTLWKQEMNAGGRKMMMKLIE